jgi:CTP:molybdopterin cytidylyltransferase MocA
MASFKPLLPFGPHTIIEHVAFIVREAAAETLRVVVGWQADLLIPVLDRHGVPWIRNEQFEEGMYSSIQAGVEGLPTGVAALFVLPGDMPLVQTATPTRLIAERDRQPSGILHPCFEGRRGHPPLIAGNYIPEILREIPPDGLRARCSAVMPTRPVRSRGHRSRHRGGPGHPGRVSAESREISASVVA